MPDEFSKWQQQPESPDQPSGFKSRARHLHRFKERERLNPYKREAARDRIIFLIVMGFILVGGSVFAIILLTSNK